MTAPGLAQFALLIALLLATAPLLGRYISRVFGDGPAPGDRFFRPIERVVYRVGGVDEDAEQGWRAYAVGVLAFSAVSLVLLFALQRLQGSLPLNPTHAVDVDPLLAFNTAASFATNTNWQNYGGETVMSHLTQMTGLAVHNFVSAAAGLAVAVALVRGLTRSKANTIGNFWVDLVRGCTRILLPLSLVVAFALAANGVIQNFNGFTEVQTVSQATQSIPGGPVASQEAIKELGTNGGGFFGANSAHPFENPNSLTNLLEIFALLLIPFSLPFAFGRMVGNKYQGYAIFAAMFILWVGAAALAQNFETQSNPMLEQAGLSGPSMEGKEVRFGPEASGLFAASTTGTSAGAVNSMHDSFSPLGGGVVLSNMMLGEVSPGGVGSGLYGILIFAIISVFIAGLMVGRTPEYLGKKIQAPEVKLAAAYILVTPFLILMFTGVSVLLDSATASIFNPGPHGLSEAVYAFTSAANNNGSAFGGLTGNTDWYNITLGLAMLFGRFVPIVAVLGMAGSMARKNAVPSTSGTFPTDKPLFVVFLVGVILVIVGLTFVPVLSLGPVLEQVMR